jgi:hypothetical protein
MEMNYCSSHKNQLTEFNATFNNISVISWRSVLLVEETEENHRPAASQMLCSVEILNKNIRLRSKTYRDFNTRILIAAIDHHYYK